MSALTRALREENGRWPKHMVAVPREQWPNSVRLTVPIVAAFRSRYFLAQLYPEINGAQRLTVSRTAVTEAGQWRAEITWDELQSVKAQCGLGDRWAAEIFPAESEVVNVANMRHLWLLPEAPAYAWTRANPLGGAA